MKLKEILSVLPFYKANNDISPITIRNIEMDSRKVKKGDLFVCIKGFTVDGHDFVEQAIDNGAVAILAEREVPSNIPIILVADTQRALAMVAAKFYNYPTTKMPLIGVTGTNGKTTVTYLLESILNANHQKTGVIGTIQMKVGDDAYPIANTTPDSLFLQKMFHTMHEQAVDTAIMEVSSHALDLGRVYGCDFDIAIFTNLSQDHLDYHKDMDDYIRAKSLLFSQLGNSYDGKDKFAIINQDDTHYSLLQRSTAQHVITYGINHEAQVMATNIQLDALLTRFTLKTPIGTIDINSRLMGMFNVYNMLAASAAAIAMSIPLDIVKSALENINGVDGRFEAVAPEQPFTTIVDYAHTSDSLDNVLQTIRGFAKGNVYVVVGCGGDRDKTKRPLMAQIALKYADQAIFTSDNPRTEDPQQILQDMINGVKGDHYEVVVDRKDAITRAVNLAKPDDIILIAGKGHETYQQIGHTKYDFDDRKVAHQAIQDKE
ncbi:UDP-N-acetylmuramoyl-L-alanyl-D-glutamate--2,6-diaminopimelate ligase [Oceanobacillus halotolerans]|uniref:UDP-N-acetylmuramoyl-L-alanyl-D-glutamate--2, 6-diaminopimelate ligase n=1 Tax=Oceanobacillus halotolerans TaxID=2663380 RepID=UPI0013DADF96|nr:UDP-N-acetylmuramoyl-L-alanyl-D-glutamate--2,6-diaminopimelate ligase [Oceanobacillus halotolerans]